MGYTTDLLIGLAQILAADGIGVWHTDGTYADNATGIVLNVVPQSPAAVVVLSTYSVGDDPIHADSVTGVQIRTRTPGEDPRPTDDLADAIFDLLQGAADLNLGGVAVQLVWRQSWTPLGADGNRRHERSDNYYLQTWRPGPNRL